MPDIGDDVDDDVNLLKDNSMTKIKDDFNKMNIVDDDDDATSCETISCSSDSSFLKSNLNNKNGRDKMIKNSFLKIFGRYYFQKWNYNTFPVKRREDGGKIEEKERLKNFEASKQRGEDHFRRKIQGVLDDVMDTILLVEEDRNEKEITQEIIDSGNDIHPSYHSLFSPSRSIHGSMTYTAKHSLREYELEKSRNRSTIIRNKRLPLSERETAVIEFNNKTKYILISHIDPNTKKQHEMYIGHSSSEKLFKIYKRWCNRDPIKWEKYLTLSFHDNKSGSFLSRSTDEYISDKKSASRFKYYSSSYSSVKPSILTNWDGNPNKPTFSWEEKQVNGIPYNLLKLLDKPVTLDDVLNPNVLKSAIVEVPLIDYFETRENDIDSNTTSESTSESSDLENDISIRSSSELTLDYGNESEIDMASSSSGTTLVSDSSVSTLDLTDDTSSDSEYGIINSRSLASTTSAASNSTYDFGSQSEIRVINSRSLASTASAASNSTYDYGSQSEIRVINSRSLASTTSAASNSTYDYGNNSESTFGSRNSLDSYYEPTIVHSIIPNNSVDQSSVRSNSDSGTDVELPGSDSTINDESIPNLQDRLPIPPSEVFLQRINLKRSYSPITLMNRSNIKAYFNIDKYSRYPSEYFGDVDKVSGIRIKEFNVKEEEKNLFSKKRKDRDVTYKYHVTQYYNEFHSYEFNSYDESKNHNTWKKIRHDHFVKSIEEEDLTSDEEDDDYNNFDEKLIKSNLNQIQAHRQKVQKDWERWCDNEGIIWF